MLNSAFGRSKTQIQRNGLLRLVRVQALKDVKPKSEVDDPPCKNVGLLKVGHYTPLQKVLVRHGFVLEKAVNTLSFFKVPTLNERDKN